MSPQRQGGPSHLLELCIPMKNAEVTPEQPHLLLSILPSSVNQSQIPLRIMATTIPVSRSICASPACWECHPQPLPSLPSDHRTTVRSSMGDTEPEGHPQLYTPNFICLTLKGKRGAGLEAQFGHRPMEWRHTPFYNQPQRGRVPARGRPTPCLELS
jgi:hypothetical protein